MIGPDQRTGAPVDRQKPARCWYLALFPDVREAEARWRAEAPPRAARRREHEHDDGHQVRQRVGPELGRPEVDLARLELRRERLQGAEEVRADEAELRPPEREDDERDRHPTGATRSSAQQVRRDRE